MPTHQKGRRELLNRRGVFQEHVARGNLSFDVDLRGEGRKKKVSLFVTVESATAAVGLHGPVPFSR